MCASPGGTLSARSGRVRMAAQYSDASGSAARTELYIYFNFSVYFNFSCGTAVRRSNCIVAISLAGTPASTVAKPAVQEALSSVSTTECKR